MQRCFHPVGFTFQDSIPGGDEDTADYDVNSGDADVLFNQVVAKVRSEDQCSSDDDMECDDPILVLMPNHPAREAVALFQRCFKLKGCTDFLSSFSAVHAYFVKRHVQKPH